MKKMITACMALTIALTINAQPDREKDGLRGPVKSYKEYIYRDSQQEFDLINSASYTRDGKYLTKNDFGTNHNYHYDNNGRLTSRTRDDGSTVMTYTYSADGKLLSDKEEGRERTYKYNQDGTKASVVYSDGCLETFEYADGKQTRHDFMNPDGKPFVKSITDGYINGVEKCVEYWKYHKDGELRFHGGYTYNNDGTVSEWFGIDDQTEHRQTRMTYEYDQYKNELYIHHYDYEDGSDEPTVKDEVNTYLYDGFGNWTHKTQKGTYDIVDTYIREYEYYE